jgi:PAS domain S-box-containing protein
VIGPRILVVEDNAITRKMMRLALQAEGFAVVEAADGAGALRIAAERTTALVLLDCKLPDLDGFEVARRLRSLDPSLPVIAVTGWARSDEILSVGVLDVLVKPVSPALLIETVQRHLLHRPPRSNGRTILVAEDDPMQRKLAQIAFSSAGFTVTSADGGAAALRLARERRPDVIVCDVLMPGMDGFSVCQEIRSDPRLKGVPIVLMSAHYLEDEDRALAARFGADRYVTRGSGFETVISAALAVLDHPPGELSSVPAETLHVQHLQRIANQLERQASLGIASARRGALQSSALSILDGLSESIGRELDPESAFDDTLARCLDAAGMSVGAILLRDARGGFAVKAHLGSTIGFDWSKHTALFQQAVELGSLMIPSEHAGDPGGALLTGLSCVSALVVPMAARGEVLGVLVLASSGTDLAGVEGEGAVRAARSVSMQLGQALCLSRLFAKVSATEQRYHALFENAADSITVLNLDGVIVEANASCERLLGARREQILGRPIWDFAPDSERESRRAQLSELVRGEGAISYPKTIRRVDGTIVQTEISRQVVHVGADRYVLSVARDVSDRLRLEEQLRQSQKMDAVGRLAGGIAHDFNNVLSVILSYAETLLLDLPEGEPMRGDVEQIFQAGRRAADLTHQLLMFSRQQVLQPKVVDLNELVQTMTKLLHRILGADVDLVCVPGASLGQIRADPGGVEQVVMNLVINARDAMPTGGKLTVETANVTLDDDFASSHYGVTAGRYVMLAVSDTGVGMDKATQARIFEPFFTTKEVGKGTGLGLSTAFGIVQQSGGSIWVYSEPGTGTTFKVFLPRIDAAPEVAQAPKVPAAGQGTETILVVEDEPQVRALVKRVLLRAGYRVLEAADGSAALALAAQEPARIDMLLTDVVMPKMSGPQLAKEISRSRPATKVLCMSGYTDDSIVRHGVLAAEIAYLQKPLRPAVLLAKVREVLDA